MCCCQPSQSAIDHDVSLIRSVVMFFLLQLSFRPGLTGTNAPAASALQNNC